MFHGHNLDQGHVCFFLKQVTINLHKHTCTHTESSTSSHPRNLFTREGKNQRWSSQLPYIFTPLFQKKNSIWTVLGFMQKNRFSQIFGLSTCLEENLFVVLGHMLSHHLRHLLTWHCHQNWGCDTANLSRWQKLPKEICWQSFWLMFQLFQLTELFQLQQATRVNQDSRD